ncbi:MAG: precorrin-6A reductase [Planctomycetes bacterium]|nr:precorrin-6A reductase [Planctomycetota bacterium]
MILLIGGTSETGECAELLLESGYEVLVSTATDEKLDLPESPRLHKRYGRLDTEQFAELISLRGINAVVDVAHPFAAALHTNALEAACKADVPYLSYERPGTGNGQADCLRVPSHEEAAAAAVKIGLPVLLTTGANSISIYAAKFSDAGLSFIVRVLPRKESVDACLDAGLSEKQIITGRGPFTVEDNIDLIRSRGIGVLVTKDSGERGGVPQKMEAARVTGCRMIIVERPENPGVARYSDMCEMVTALALCLRS